MQTFYYEIHASDLSMASHPEASDFFHTAGYLGISFLDS